MIEIRKACSSREIAQAVAIQKRVFCDEQGISVPDCIEGNEDSEHLIALDGEQIVATARLRPMSEFEAEVARIAVLPDYRSSGIGRKMVQQVEVMAGKTDARVLELHPHAGLEGFYAALGYAKTDAPSYYVGENLIITMRKSITDTEG